MNLVINNLTKMADAILCTNGYKIPILRGIIKVWQSDLFAAFHCEIRGFRYNWKMAVVEIVKKHRIGPPSKPAYPPAG